VTLTPEEQAQRLLGVGGSESATAVGLNPYESRVELWQEKRGLVPPFAGNAPTKWGQLLEQVVRQEYAEQTGRVVRLPVALLKHPRVAIAFCHPDGITDDGRLYEGKTARYPDGWGEAGTDEIPEHYLVQVQHNLAVTSLPVADVAVLIGGQDFRLYEVPADRAFQQDILDAEAEFWDYVVRGEPPPVDCASPGALQVLKKLYPGTNGQVVFADDQMERLWRPQLEQATAAEKEIKALQAEAKAELLNYMGEAALLRFADGRCLRRQRVDKKAYSVAESSYIDVRLVNAPK
jgi:putative phage-type endonuclease